MMRIGYIDFGNRNSWRYAWVMKQWFGIFRNRKGVMPGRWGFYLLGFEFGSRNPQDPVGTFLKRCRLWPWRPKTVSRYDELPLKFKHQERYAYVWLYDCRIDLWSVDMLDKTVTDHSVTPENQYPSLVAFAKFKGCKTIPTESEAAK